MTTITGKERIALARLMAIRGAVRLEHMGLRRRGQSAYSIAKNELGLKGNRQKVLDQLDTIIKNRKEELMEDAT